MMSLPITARNRIRQDARITAAVKVSLTSSNGVGLIDVTYYHDCLNAQLYEKDLCGVVVSLPFKPYYTLLVIAAILNVCFALD